ncbi:MAG: alpha/beta hydrolase [Pseudomonadota bacterium]
MSEMDRDEAVGFLTAAVDESHDSLVRFTDKLAHMGEAPAFWLRDFPVHVRAKGANRCAWPILARRTYWMTISGRAADYELPRRALAEATVTLAGTPLTPAEATLFEDLAAGFSLEDSAQEAGVAVTTRRKQVQRVFRKLGVSSQVELVALASRWLHDLAGEIGDLHQSASKGWEPYARFLPEGARHGVLCSTGETATRYLDVGPVGGKPVMVLHPMVFPNIGLEEVALCHDLGWRALWPIRPGCLSTATHTSTGWEAHCREVVSGMAALHEMIGGGPIPLMSLVSGGAYATAYAETYPERVSRIDLVSTCFSGGKSSSRDIYFGEAFLRSVRQNGRMAFAAVQHLAGSLARHRDYREKTARRVFGDCEIDQALLDEDFGTPERDDRFTFATLHSMDSMRYDYMAQIKFSWRRAAALPIPKVFWHGAEDRVHNADDLKRLAQTVMGAPARILPGTGHLTQGAPLRDIFRRIAADIPQTG